MSVVVRAENLSRWYGRRLAVDRVSFEVAQGEVVGLLGPNGSGKSTILRILTGYLKPSGGAASIAGHDVVDDSLEARRHVGYVPEDVPLYPHMRVQEFLRFMGRLRGVAEPALPDAVEDAVGRLRLDKVRDLPIAKLSRGYRQRVAIAQALLNAPRLLVFDEPTNGLDPRQIIELRGLIRSLSAQHAIVITSHILAEIERTAHRALILLDGRLLGTHVMGSGEALEDVFLRLTETLPDGVPA
ncbi:MAG: ABC transporter ATP-binding protein [Burkholderiales bacterium]|nr:ABC transporter ATP-binding protein [Burkholderiales bacterium]